jgi:hypothetical protein
VLWRSGSSGGGKGGTRKSAQETAIIFRNESVELIIVVGNSTECMQQPRVKTDIAKLSCTTGWVGWFPLPGAPASEDP